MLKIFLFLLIFIPFTVMAQYSVSGRVVDSVTKKPVAVASVFLSNASAGATTKDDGTFLISNVRGGQYNLVVSIIGYATYRQTIMANKDIVLPDLSISPQAIQLQEVSIGIDSHWAEHYARFKREFLGTTDNAGQCDILNPHALSFSNSHGIFSAMADTTLVIINKALGYRINYILSAFTDDSKTGLLYFEGEAFFQDIPGNRRKLKKWNNNRLQTYLGSDMQFLRSVITSQVKEEGFVVRRLIRKLNPDYKGGLNNKYILTLVATPLKIGEYAALTDQKGEYALSFDDCLAIDYKDNNLGSTILAFGSKYVYFDNNGIILNPQGVTMQGGWAESKMAGMLPVDYEPPNK